MFPEQEIQGFERYWRRRKPGSSTAVHYGSDVRIFFKWIKGKQPKTISMHDVDGFIEWQQRLGRAPGTIRRRLIKHRLEQLCFLTQYFDFSFISHRSQLFFNGLVRSAAFTG